MTILHPRTVALLSRPQWTQRTAEWYEIRKELLTASDAAAALDVKPYPSYRGSAKAELLKRKLTNAPLQNMFVVHGQKYEDAARDWAAAALGETIIDVGLVRHPTLPWLGASPDGVTTSGKLVEIKAPLKRNIVPGEVPHHYWPQVQVQMETCDVDSTLFVQYKPAHVSNDGKAFLDITIVERDRGWFRDNVSALRETWEDVMRLKREAPPRVDTAPPSLCTIVDDLYCTESDCTKD